MKYIRYTLVDNKTEVPVTQSPAMNGPKHPDGIDHVFSIESTFSTGAPIMYGTADDGYEPLDFMGVVDEDAFQETRKGEYKDRAREKRKEVEKGGVTMEDGTIVQTNKDSQNRLAALVSDGDAESFDFETSEGHWETLSREDIISMNKAVSKHVQSCFTWCKNIHKKIDEENVDFHEIEKDIKSFGSEEEERELTDAA